MMRKLLCLMSKIATEKMPRCPKCGFKPPPKGTQQLRIWVSGDTENQFREYAKEYKNAQEALISLLEKAKRLDQLERRPRIAVERPGV